LRTSSPSSQNTCISSQKRQSLLSSQQQQQQSSTSTATPVILFNKSFDILSMRIPPAYTNFINPDGPLHPPRFFFI
jgi:hypothetical protein